MKTLKAVGAAVLFIYATNFAIDYFTARTSASVTPQFCQHWFHSIPWWGHLMIPGTGNACLDKGYLPHE